LRLQASIPASLRCIYAILVWSFSGNQDSAEAVLGLDHGGSMGYWMDQPRAEVYYDENTNDALYSESEQYEGPYDGMDLLDTTAYLRKSTALIL